VGVGNDFTADAAQGGCGCIDEPKQRIAHVAFVSILVGREPLAIVVPAQRPKEREQCRSEVKHPAQSA